MEGEREGEVVLLPKRSVQEEAILHFLVLKDGDRIRYW